MDKIRKTFQWLWFAKERIVLVAMLFLLGVRIHSIFNPEAGEDPIASFGPPRTELQEDVDRPGIPPRTATSDIKGDWASVVRQPPFIYDDREGSGGPRTPDPSAALGLKLIMIQTTRGITKAFIETPNGARKWYEEGESFEKYQLLRIDAENNTCDLYDDSEAREVTISKSR